MPTLLILGIFLIAIATSILVSFGCMRVNVPVAIALIIAGTMLILIHFKVIPSFLGSF